MLLTCRTCKKTGSCEKQDSVKSAVKGLGLTSYKIKCKEKVELFEAGQPVTFSTLMSTSGYEGDYSEGEYIKFNGVVIRKTPRGLKYHLYCVPDSESLCGEYVFDAKNRGFCNIPMSRIHKVDGDLHSFCPTEGFCEYISDIKEHDNYCKFSGLSDEEKTKINRDEMEEHLPF
jgi:hypothetical protein